MGEWVGGGAKYSKNLRIRLPQIAYPLGPFKSDPRCFSKPAVNETPLRDERPGFDSRHRKGFSFPFVAASRPTPGQNQPLSSR